MDDLVLHFSIASTDPRLKQYKIVYRILNSFYSKIAAILWSLFVTIFFVLFLILIFNALDVVQCILFIVFALMFGLMVYEVLFTLKGRPGTVSQDALFLKDYLSLIAQQIVGEYTLKINNEGINVNNHTVSFSDIFKVEVYRSDAKMHFVKIILHKDVLDLLIWRAPRSHMKLVGSKEIILIPQEAFTEEQKETFLTYIRKYTKLGTIQQL